MANVEAYPPSNESDPTVSSAGPWPHLVIDDAAGPELAVQLTDLQRKFHAEPDAHLAELRRFITDPGAVSADAPWHQLTERSEPLCRSYWFDDDTQSHIQHDPVHHDIIGSRREDQGRLLRARALEILLERTITARRLGNLSLEADE